MEPPGVKPRGMYKRRWKGQIKEGIDLTTDNSIGEKADLSHPPIFHEEKTVEEPGQEGDFLELA